MKHVILFCFALTVLLSACGAQSGNAPTINSEPAEAITSTYSAPVGSIRANGILLPAREVDLSFGESGRIDSITVHIGEIVTEGQELARLVSTQMVKEESAIALQEIADAGKAVEEARSRLYYLYLPPVLAGLESLEALNTANENLTQAQADYKPCKLLPSQNRACKDKKERLENAQGTYNAAVRQIEFEAALLSAEAKLEKAKQDYGKLQNASNDGWFYSEPMVIIAPFNGTISSMYLYRSEWASPGQTIIELQDTSRWRIETKNVSELEIGRIILGQEVRAIVNAFRDKPLTGYVIEIAPEAVVQQGDVTYTLIIELEPTDLKLRPGMTVQVEIMTDNE